MTSGMKIEAVNLSALLMSEVTQGSSRIYRECLYREIPVKRTASEDEMT
jgi:hypothetical protein